MTPLIHPFYTLRPDYRKAAFLNIGYSWWEIAGLLHVTVDTVRLRIAKSNAKLKT